ncbi:hypothetical protein V1477_018424 [Vespula maculifrons]|uniref:REJ domain-containing protein n=1 Tax=Vespula maculifrons TaxID=7453 RepID=A0ABD2AVC5_VESMC
MVQKWSTTEETLKRATLRFVEAGGNTTTITTTTTTTTPPTTTTTTTTTTLVRNGSSSYNSDGAKRESLQFCSLLGDARKSGR